MSDGILHIDAPKYPHLHFEWHERKKIVYRGDLRAKPVKFEPIAFNIDSHGAAQNAVLIWLRGYSFAHAERITHVGPLAHLHA